METCLIRQPVMDREHVVFGYELLFRSGSDELFRRLDEADDTVYALDQSNHLGGLQRISEGRKCFIKFNRNQLLKRAYTALPPESTVVEVSVSERLDKELIETSRHVRDSGYMLALDDFVVEPRLQPLLGSINLLKVDFPALAGEQHEVIVQSGIEHGFSVVAAGLKTPDDFTQASQYGYTYFQGYFFCHPQRTDIRSIPTNRVQYLRLLQVVNEQDFSVDRIDEFIRQDVSLSVKLLKYLNSPTFALRAKVSSIRQAVGHMGQRPLQKWVSLITVRELSREKPLVLMNTSLIRAKFCEAIGERSLKGQMASEGFLGGMFSLLDAILDQPMSGVLKEFALSPSLRDALLRIESPLRNVLDLAKALEDADWRWVSALVYQLQIDEDTVFAEYRDAVIWACDIFNGLN